MCEATHQDEAARQTLDDGGRSRGRRRGPGPGPRAASPPDAGMATAEYAVATLAAVGFAGLLLTVLRSPDVQEMLLDLIQRALQVAG